ncbi:hypothetical protein GCM10009840_28370 [Pseudolysinimonas kribbensis]|uniref:Uncharacterized protein n=1 Tax=Pseudolysinimonas kribbensis TaxID=433641 RepID=A0ABQ6KAG7_9MICO|nr:hypothetical protein GCM10025881_31630 [Pseudolysinimonas kribbensis]
MANAWTVNFCEGCASFQLANDLSNATSVAPLSTQTLEAPPAVPFPAAPLGAGPAVPHALSTAVAAIAAAAINDRRVLVVILGMDVLVSGRRTTGAVRSAAAPPTQARY